MPHPLSILEYHWPGEWNARPGDVVHVRSANPFARTIRIALPRETHGNHDGTLVYEPSRGWGVAEALVQPGYVVTEWEHYWKEIAAGRVSVVFCRPVNMPTEVGLDIVHAAYELEALQPKYDRLAIVSIAANIAFKKTISRHREWQWYCTEAVRDLHLKATRDGEFDAWGPGFPTPYTTEKRIEQGRLEVVGEVGVVSYEQWRARHPIDLHAA